MKHIETIKEILQLPWVSTDELDLLPEDPGVYFVMSAGKVIYVGKAQNLMRRWMSHHRLDQVRLVGDADIHYAVVAVEDVGMLEVEMIELFSPLLNNTRSPVNPLIEMAEPVKTRQRSPMELLVDQLSQIRGQPISLATFYRWLSVCQIPAKGRSKSGYTEDEVAILEQLAEHLRDGFNYESFIESMNLPT